jgi:hypothetical protein
MREIDPYYWQGIEAAFNGVDIRWENYPAETQTREPGTPSLPGIHVPDRWGHFRRGHKFGRYNAVIARLDKDYEREQLAMLDRLWPLEYAPAKQITVYQKIAFCAYWHNYEGLNRAIDELMQETAAAAVEDYKRSQLTPLQRKRADNLALRDHPARPDLSLDDLDDDGDPLLPDARAIQSSQITTIGVLQKHLRIGEPRARHLFEILIKENQNGLQKENHA